MHFRNSQTSPFVLARNDQSSRVQNEKILQTSIHNNVQDYCSFFFFSFRNSQVWKLLPTSQVQTTSIQLMEPSNQIHSNEPWSTYPSSNRWTSQICQEPRVSLCIYRVPQQKQETNTAQRAFYFIIVTCDKKKLLLIFFPVRSRHLMLW